MKHKRCDLCENRNKTLRVCFSEPLSEVLNIYEMANVQKPLVAEQWQSYLKNTTVNTYTLCLKCSREIDKFLMDPIATRIAAEWLAIYRTKEDDSKRRKMRAGRANVAVSSDSEDGSDNFVAGDAKASDEPHVVSMMTKDILTAWLSMVAKAPPAEVVEEDTTSDDSHVQIV